METDREIVQRHVAALMQEAAAARVPGDVVGRLLLEQTIAIWRAHRADADIQSELRFTADHLDPDTDFEFMRP